MFVVETFEVMIKGNNVHYNSTIKILELIVAFVAHRHEKLGNSKIYFQFFT